MKMKFEAGPSFSVLLLSLFFFAFAGATLVGCDDEEVGNDGQEDTGVNELEPDTEEVEIICDPGEIDRCAGVEQSGVFICNDDGTAIIAGECPGTSICRDGACEEVMCRPNSGRCIDGIPQRCVDDGEGDYLFEDQEPCEEDESCEEGVCLDRCGLAELTHSYVGCEYWAVETENTLLYQTGLGNESVPPEHRPPFAVVLANTEANIDAEVTVRGPDGELAQAVQSREVRSDRSNPGEEWVTVHSETVDADGNRIGTPHSGPIENIVLPPNATLTLLLPNQDIPFGATTVTSTAYQITSSQPVVAYQFNPFCCNYNYTNDASLLLPTSALTENYMMMSHAVWAGDALNRLPSPRSPTLSVVAMEDDTRVEVHLKGPVSEGRTFAGKLYPVRDTDRVLGPDNNGYMEVTLNAHEVFNVAGAGTSPVVDLTGTRVKADKPVAVFGAHTCTNIPFTSPACDHLESQLFPMETWATGFVASPLKIRNPNPPSGSREGTYWKFLARDDDTVIEAGTSIAPSSVLPPSGEGVPRCADFSSDPASGVFEMDAGESCEFGTRHMFSVQSNRPIMVGGFISGQNTVFDQVNWGDHAGDPSLFLLPPQEQFRSSYTFLTPPTYHVSYITVTMNTGYDLILDGERINPLDHPHEILEDENILMAHIEVDPGPHQISSNSPFGLVVYGYDNYVSYAYTGGLDLTKLNPLR